MNLDRFLRSMESHGEDEAVTVDTRALIDKVLARYSADFTTFRELIQNAADAKASRVTIKLETLPSVSVPLPVERDDASILRHTITHHTIQKVTISNNGQYFRPEDWARLKNIAEGNPDETKIGAFGVGFYSVFADCEEPFVISGHKALRFFWKKNRLFTRALNIDTQDPPSETTFVLQYRDQSTPIPDLAALCKFFCSSFTFVALEEIDLWLDKFRIFHLRKLLAPDRPLELPRSLKTTSPDGILSITGARHRTGQISSKWMNAIVLPRKPTGLMAAELDETVGPLPTLRSIFSSLTKSAATKKKEEEKIAARTAVAENPTQHSSATIFFRVTSVDMASHVGQKFAAELERATKKPPPKKAAVEVLTASLNGNNSALTGLDGLTSDHASKLFEDVLPHHRGRIYIGFPTSQTTGFLAHVSAPSVIPTVERESIDLNARHVSVWNSSMLSMAGIACRLAYIDEMRSLKESFEANLAAEKRAVSDKDVEQAIPNVASVFKQYTGYTSTPFASVGERIQGAFWDASASSSIELFSTKGFRQSSEVRLAEESLLFLQDLPLIPPELVEKAEMFLSALFKRGLLRVVTVGDIVNELSNRTISENEAVQLLKWLSARGNKDLAGNDVRDILQTAVVRLDSDEAAVKPNEGGDSQVNSPTLLPLGTVTTFLGSGGAFANIVTPDHTIPFRISKHFSRSQLTAFGWSELQVTTWLDFIITCHPAFTSSADFSSKVHGVLGRQWGTLNYNSQTKIVEMLSSLSCLPTGTGLVKPHEAYFPQAAKGFSGLPVISPEIAKLKEGYLKALGVRLALDLNILITSLMLPATASDPSKLFNIVKYLATVASDIPEADMKGLRKAKVWPAIRMLEEPVPEKDRYTINSLFEPTEDNKQLGVLVLNWPSSQSSFFDSKEMKFLKGLGLQISPNKAQLVERMLYAADANLPDLYQRCFDKFVNLPAGLDSWISSQPFVPTEDLPWPNLKRPDQVFVNEGARLFGFYRLQTSLAAHSTRLGVREHPPITDCIAKLGRELRPVTRQEAVDRFGYLSERLGEIKLTERDKLATMDIVPIFFNQEVVRYATPRFVILGPPSPLFKDILDFVDFGPANLFLQYLGAKQEPSTIDVAHILVQAPGKILERAGPEGYLEQLKRITEHETTLRSSKVLWKDLTTLPVLLAYQDVYGKREGTARNQRGSSLVGSLKNLAIGRGNKDGGLLESDEDDEDDEDQPLERQWHLRRASEIVIIGDSHRDFGNFRDVLYVAPADDILEGFYERLGVPFLVDRIEKRFQIGPKLPDQSLASNLHRQIVERSRVFLFDQERRRVRKDGQWVDRDLKVETVHSIVTTSQLRGHPKIVRLPLTALEGRRGSSTVLYITSRPDLYDVSHSLVKMLLHKPTQNDTIALEMILTTDLKRLKAKGYNVDRILRSREKEMAVKNKIAAEEAERMREAERLKEAERMKELSGPPLRPPPPYMAEPAAAREAAISEPPRATNGEIGQSGKGGGKSVAGPAPPHVPNIPSRGPQAMMPGGFNDPDDSPIQHRHSKPGEPGSNAGGGDGSHTFPPKHTLRDPSAATAVSNFFGAGSAGQGGAGSAGVNQKELESTLQSAISQTRPTGSSEITSPPSSRMIEEARQTYCDASAGQDLVRMGSVRDVAFFVPRAHGLSASVGDKLKARQPELVEFAVLLTRLEGLFGMQRGSVNVFWSDGDQRTIAFNQGGTIFCNFRFWIGFGIGDDGAGGGGDGASAAVRDASSLAPGPTSLWNSFITRAISPNGGGGGGTSQGRDGGSSVGDRERMNFQDPLSWHYWYVTISHEIAHNLVREHNSDHGFFTESLIHRFFGPFVGLVLREGLSWDG